MQKQALNHLSKNLLTVVHRAVGNLLPFLQVTWEPGAAALDLLFLARDSMECKEGVSGRQFTAARVLCVLLLAKVA